MAPKTATDDGASTSGRTASVLNFATAKRSEVTRLRVDELRRELEALGITPEGKKSDLVDTLWYQISGRQTEATVAEEEGASPASPLPADVLENVRRSLARRPLLVRLQTALALRDRDGLMEIRRLIRPTSIGVIRQANARPETVSIPASDAGETILREKLTEALTAPMRSEIEIKNAYVGVRVVFRSLDEGSIQIIPYGVPHTTLSMRFFLKKGHPMQITVDKLKLSYDFSLYMRMYGQDMSRYAATAAHTEYLSDALVGVQWLREWIFNPEIIAGAKISVSPLLEPEVYVRDPYQNDFPVAARDRMAFLKKAVKMLKAK